jgi:hypothetical protein
MAILVGVRRLPLKYGAVSKRFRTAIVLCATWLIIALVIALYQGESCSFDTPRSTPRCFLNFPQFAISFLEFGVLPLVLIWGVIWVRTTQPTNTDGSGQEELNRTQPPTEGPPCPDCGAPTKLRTMRTSQNWVCTNYPNCVKVMPIESKHRR